MDTRSELVQLLAKVIYRMVVQPKILAPQNDPHSQQDCLAVSPKRLLSVTNVVNTELSGENK
jgi:hypothetical protein